MFPIDNRNSEAPRTPRQRPEGRDDALHQTDRTQRVRLDGTVPERRDPPSRRRTPSRKSSRSFLQRMDKRTLIILCVVAAVLLIALIVVIAMASKSTPDDGLILNNVYAAGVNLGGKTPEQAKIALINATGETYTKLDMVVQVKDQTVNLSPGNTGASLDVDAVVDAAYNYGRTGTRAERQRAKDQAATSSYTISVLPYLNLNEDYIRSEMEQLGTTYSSTLSQPEYSISGSKPDLNTPPEQIDLSKVYQTLTITLGTPEYGLDVEKLYEQIMDAYNINLFQVTGDLTVIIPDELDAQALFDSYCTAPVDAELDTDTYEVVEGSYGYGFDLEELRTQLETAQWGQTLEIGLTFLRPTYTAEDLAGDLFKDVLASRSITASGNADLLTNLGLACKALNGLILKADEEFSFNTTLGKPTASAGYKTVEVYVDTELQEVLGGGLSQVASPLYYCALAADLEILERSNHSYSPGFIENGLDADVLYGSKDLIFKNTTGRPIRIEAELADNGALQIRLLGTKDSSYTVDVAYEITKTYTPVTLTTELYADSAGNYKDGQVLVEPITGYDTTTYQVYRYTDGEIIKKAVAYSHYEKRNALVISLKEPPQVTTPPTTEPSEPPTSEPNPE